MPTLLQAQALRQQERRLQLAEQQRKNEADKQVRADKIAARHHVAQVRVLRLPRPSHLSTACALTGGALGTNELRTALPLTALPQTLPQTARRLKAPG